MYLNGNPAPSSKGPRLKFTQPKEPKLTSEQVEEAISYSRSRFAADLKCATNRLVDDLKHAEHQFAIAAGTLPVEVYPYLSLKSESERSELAHYVQVILKDHAHEAFEGSHFWAMMTFEAEVRDFTKREMEVP